MGRKKGHGARTLQADVLQEEKPAPMLRAPLPWVEPPPVERLESPDDWVELLQAACSRDARRQLEERFSRNFAPYMKVSVYEGSATGNPALRIDSSMSASMIWLTGRVAVVHSVGIVGDGPLLAEEDAAMASRWSMAMQVLLRLACVPELTASHRLGPCDYCCWNIGRDGNYSVQLGEPSTSDHVFGSMQAVVGDKFSCRFEGFCKFASGQRRLVSALGVDRVSTEPRPDLLNFAKAIDIFESSSVKTHCTRWNGVKLEEISNPTGLRPKDEVIRFKYEEDEEGFVLRDNSAPLTHCEVLALCEEFGGTGMDIRAVEESAKYGAFNTLVGSLRMATMVGLLMVDAGGV